MPNDKGFYDMHQPDSKTQPARVPNRPSSEHGDGHEFNIKGKITNNAGSDYHDVHRPSSGLHGNFAEKDAQLAYLTERGKKGQVIKSYTGTHENSRLHTYNTGPTAYNNKPIDEVYKPATSQHVPPYSTPSIPVEAQKTDNAIPAKNPKYTAKKLK